MATMRDEELTSIALHTQSREWEGRETLVIDPLNFNALRQWQREDSAASVSILSRRWDVASSIPPRSKRAPHFGDRWRDPDARFDAVVAWLPKGKALQAMTWAIAADALAPGGRLVVVGHNKEGIKSAPRGLSMFFGSVEKLESVRHCVVLRAEDPLDNPDERAAAMAPNIWKLPERFGAHEIHNLPGAFSADGLDPGTELLLDNLPADLSTGRVLDAACGAGVISIVCASRSPEIEIEAVDVDAMALASARLSAEAAGLAERIEFYPSDVYGAVMGRFDLIVSNPPFHHGHRPDLELAERFVRDSRSHLKPGGSLLIVCNRTLPYPKWMEDTFGRVIKVAEDGRYRVWMSRMPGGRLTSR